MSILSYQWSRDFSRVVHEIGIVRLVFWEPLSKRIELAFPPC